MDVGALQAHVMEDRRESWIRRGIAHVVRHPRLVSHFIAEAHAVVLQRGSREQLDPVSEVTLVFESCTGAPPWRSVTTLPGTEHIELLGRAPALIDRGDL